MRQATKKRSQKQEKQQQLSMLSNPELNRRTMTKVAIAKRCCVSADRIVINLKSGATFSFPPEIAQGLAGASPEDLAEVEVTPSGDGLHWEKLDADFSVPALLAGVFGTAAWMDKIDLLHKSWNAL